MSANPNKNKSREEMLQHPGNRTSWESYDVEVGFCALMHTHKEKHMERTSPAKGASGCLSSCLVVFPLSVWYWQRKTSPTSVTHFSGWGMGAIVSHRRVQKHCLTLCGKTGCTGSSCLGLLSLFPCLFHRKWSKKSCENLC